MNNSSKILKLIGFTILILVFFNNVFSYSRLLVSLLGIIIIFVSFLINEKRNIKSCILIPLVTLALAIFLDAILVCSFNRNPIFAYEIRSSDNFITYNATGYRLFKCNKNTYVDLLYRKSNYCSKNTLEEKDINIISSDIINSFNKYKNKFYLIKAKVSYKEGNNIIELKSYNSETSDINGNVTFNDNIVYKLKFNMLENIDNLKVYDNVEIVGRFSSYKKEDGNYIVYIKDVYIPKSKTYDEYKINVVENKKCEKDKTEYVVLNDIKYYTSCLSKIYVVFSENEVYELSYVLKDEKITLNNLLKGYKENLNNSNINANLYKFETYNILECDDNNIIIGNTKLDFDNNYCNVKDSDNNEL